MLIKNFFCVLIFISFALSSFFVFADDFLDDKIKITDDVGGPDGDVSKKSKNKLFIKQWALTKSKNNQPNNTDGSSDSSNGNNGNTSSSVPSPNAAGSVVVGAGAKAPKEINNVIDTHGGDIIVIGK